MKEADLQCLGAYLRTVREASGLSIRELAARANTHHAYLARVEKSERRPNGEWLQKIAAQLNDAKPNSIDASRLLAYIGIKPSSVLPPLRTYFSRKLGATEEEADMLANVVQYLHKKNEKEKPSEDTKRARNDGPD